jgi:hypothetical protein
MPLRRLLLRQPRRAPRQQQRNDVGEIVDGVRNQRQRVGGVAEDQLGNDERRVERAPMANAQPKLSGAWLWPA